MKKLMILMSLTLALALTSCAKPADPVQPDPPAQSSSSTAPEQSSQTAPEQSSQLQPEAPVYFQPMNAEDIVHLAGQNVAYIFHQTDEYGSGSIEFLCGMERFQVRDYCDGVGAGYYYNVSDALGYVLFEDIFPNDYRDIFLIEVTPEGAKLVDTLGAGFSEISGEEPTFAAGTKIDVLGTYTGVKHYRIEDGRFVTDNAVYQFASYDPEYRRSMTTLQELKATSKGAELAIPADTVIYPTGADVDAQIFYFALEDGTECQVDYVRDEDAWELTVNGVNEYELFDSVMYAG